MLIITRKPGEKIMLGDDVVVHVMEIVGNSVRIGIQAPRSLPVYREEIWDAVREENAGRRDGDARTRLPAPAASAGLTVPCTRGRVPSRVQHRTLTTHQFEERSRWPRSAAKARPRATWRSPRRRSRWRK